MGSEIKGCQSGLLLLTGLMVNLRHAGLYSTDSLSYHIRKTLEAIRTRGRRFLVNCVPMREQRTAKLTLNSVSYILKLIPLFSVSSQKVTLSNVVN